MSKRRPHRSIRIDERARVPFAIIAIILLLSSVTIVYALEAREAPEPSTTQSEEMDQTRAVAQAELRDSVRAATQRAAAAPITKANLDSAIGEAIGTDESGNEVGERRLFENYVSVLVYRDLQQSLGTAEQDARDGTRTAASVPVVDWSDKGDVEGVIDRVEISHQGSDSSMDPGLAEVTVDGVYFHVGEDSAVDRRRETLSVTVGTSVFELRDKMQQYDDDLSSGTIDPTDPGAFGGAFAARMYPFTWGKSYVDRLELHGNDGRAFPFVVDHNHTEVFANQALFAAQEEVFGTKDPHHRRVMRGPQLCMASDLIDSVSSDEVYDENEIAERANQSLPDSVVIDGPEDLCNNELLVGDVSGDMGELNFFDLVIGPLFNQANDQFQGQDIHLVPIAELAYAETVPDFNYDEDREGEFREALNDTDRFGEEFVEGHFGEVDRGNSDFTNAMDDYSSDFTAVRDGEDARNFTDVVDDVYAVDLFVDTSSSDDSVSIGSTSPPTGNHTEHDRREYDVYGDSISVERTEPIDEWSGQSGRLVTVEVTYDASISATDVYKNESDGSEREVSAGDDSVTLSKTYEIDGTIAPDVKAWGTGASGVENVFDDDSDPFGSNWQGAPDKAYDNVFDSDDLESELSADGEDLESDLESDTSVSNWFDSQLDSLSVESNPEDLDMSPSDDSINAWLAHETREEHMSLVTEMDPVNATMVEIVESDPSPISEFRDPVESNQTAAVRDVTSRSSTYDDAVQLAEAEAKHAYYQNLLNRIDATASLNENQSGSLTDGFDFNVMGHLDFITDFTAADVEQNTGQVRGGPLLEDVDYQIDASPTYLEMNTVNRSTDPAVRPAGNGPLDVEDTEHGSLASRYDNAFGFPGFPLLPFPPSLFYLQADAWHVTLQGEYARFEIQATSGSGSSTGGTTLVRENRSVTIADQEIGSVEPIDIDQKLPMFVIVPAPTLLAKGSPGTGDMHLQNNVDSFDCTDTWDNTGPGYDQNTVDDAKDGGTHCSSALEDAISEFLP